MAERNKTKAERRQAAAAQPTTKGERKQAKARRKQGAGSPAEAVEPMAAAEGSPGDGIDVRLARLEEAVAAQSELSEQLLGKLDEVLHEARKSARLAKGAATQPGQEGREEPAEGL
jgi:hypothetical protein